jgi:predicted nuclease with RNAse H fold
MKKIYNILGIDLGGCMSGNSAYIYAQVSDNKIKIIEAFKEPKHKDHVSCQQYIINIIEKYEVDAIAIDAPLSLPAPLLDPSRVNPPRKGTGEIINPYLFRYTDYYLFKTYGLRPMPPAGDRIGRLTARAIALLHHFEYQFPHITIKGKQVPIYEVYPKQIAQSLSFINYKKTPDNVLKYFNQKSDFDEHLVDALLCVYAGAKILQGVTDDIVEEAKGEGWCFPV